MADSNMLNEELHHYEPEPETVPEPEPETTPELVPEEPESAAPEPLSVTPPEPVPEEPDSTSEPVPEPVPDLFSVDEIVDLVGGARDALERHRAEDSAPPVTETLEEPVTIPEPVIPDSTTSSVPEELPVEVPVVPVVPEESPVEVPVEVPVVPPVVAPIAVPESVKLAPVAPAPPVPAPPPAAEARTAAEAPAPSYETSPSKAPSLPLMHFPTVVDLLYWRDVRSTGVVFGAALLLLLSLTACSIVSVSAYIGLALLSITICLRIYRGVLQAVQKSDEGHPFRQYLDQEVALSEDLVHKYSDAILERLNKTIVDLRRVFLVEDLVDSIKFAVLMWILTYVGSWFNGLTLLILGLIAAFSCPIVYEKHQAQIDHYVSLVNNQIKDVVGKVQAKVPGMKPKAE